MKFDRDSLLAPKPNLPTWSLSRHTFWPCWIACKVCSWSGPWNLDWQTAGGWLDKYHEQTAHMFVSSILVMVVVALFFFLSNLLCFRHRPMLHIKTIIQQLSGNHSQLDLVPSSSYSRTIPPHWCGSGERVGQCLHTVSGLLLPSFRMGWHVAFALAGCIVINRDPQQAVGGGDGASWVGFDLVVISGGGRLGIR